MADLEATNAPFCEVWFNISQAAEYEPLFAELKRRRMDVGLHFWGSLADGTWANIAHTDASVTDQSLKLMKQSIDIAADHNFQYVNIHPGSRALVAIDFTREKFELKSAPIALETAHELFIIRAKSLHEYAADRNVVFTVETVPSRVTNGWKGAQSRNNPTDIYELPNDSVVGAAQSGIWVANDFGHTPATVISNNRTEVLEYLVSVTKILAPQTRLLHLNYIIPPYNGTDFHDQLDNPLLDTDAAVPNKTEMMALVKPFLHREDVWALVEPSTNHADNYFLMKQLLEKAAQ